MNQIKKGKYEMNEVLKAALNAIESCNYKGNDQGIVIASLILWKGLNDLDYHMINGTDSICGIGEGCVIASNTIASAIGNLSDALESIGEA